MRFVPMTATAPARFTNAPWPFAATPTQQVVSVIIAAYNAAATLPECLAALHRQKLPPHIALEIIVSDDGSTDATVDVARTAGAICVLRADAPAAPVGPEPEWLIWRPAGAAPSSGPGAARNRGVAVSTGEIILFTDADCAPTPDWVATLLTAFDDPQVAGVKGTYLTRQKDLLARFVQLEYADKYHHMARREWIDFVDAYSAGYRRAVFVENGGFETGMMGNEDHELSFRLAEKGYRLKFVPQAAVFHQHLTSIQRYLRRKFTIGYWKMQLLRWHPEKMLGDSHTPPTQRWQIFLVGPLLLAALIGLVWFHALWMALGLLAVFTVTALPFLLWAVRRDAPVALVALPLLLGRALAQALGLGVGLIASYRRAPLRSSPLGSSALFIKRAFDVLFAGLGLIFSAPIIAMLALLIKTESRGPVFFRQTRVGQHGRPFTCYKLRSMVDGAEQQLDNVLAHNHLSGPAFKIPGDPRVTRLGRFMRRWSLDELPQFWNILRGEMSMVGPRPEEPRVVAQYTDWHRQRLAVRPGLTGPMQINGRGNLSLDDRVRLELDYIERYSLWRDVEIVLRSIPVIISGHGAY